MTAPRAPQGEFRRTPEVIAELVAQKAALVAALRAFLYARFDQLGQMADHDTLVQQARAALARASAGSEPTRASGESTVAEGD